jgi:hypothetical protein
VHILRGIICGGASPHAYCWQPYTLRGRACGHRMRDGAQLSSANLQCGTLWQTALLLFFPAFLPLLPAARHTLPGRDSKLAHAGGPVGEKECQDLRPLSERG